MLSCYSLLASLATRMKERELFQVLVARKVRKKQLVDLFEWSIQRKVNYL
jgi:hypothetical protein